MNRYSNKKRAGGFTLVEVLVALVVLSIGLLGVGKLVLTAVKADNSAYMRSQAVELTYTMLDDMRANRSTGLTHGYDTPFGTYANPGLNCIGTAGTCAATQIAQYDIYQWKQNLLSALPKGDGQIVTASNVITINGVNFTQVTATITVQWDDSVAQWALGTPSTTTPVAMSVALESVL